MPLTYRHRTLAPLLAALVMTACATPPAPAPSAPPAATPAAPPATAAPAAVPAPARSQDFAQWVDRFRAEARAAGITDATLHAAFDGVQHLDQVIALDRAQPEFTRTVWDYLDTAVSPTRVARGQDKLLEVRAVADAAAARYGVPAEIVVAIWGMESNYGSNYGDTPTIDALATLGFEGRRAAWARGQLMAALRILQNGDIPRERMLGSWAGAMGQTQFLPSNFLAYAVDADGDGRRDIWGSMADVTASTAHFLAREGWQRGQPWGLEVQLPPGFDLGRADDALRQSSTQWAAEGVRAMDGTALPALPDASLLLPAGARGPVFLVGPNFRAILRYNNATSYALGVGLLAQRLAGGPAVQAAWPRDLQPLSRNALQTLQQALQSQGFDPGGIDGVLGPATRGAIRRWQRSVGLAADGFPTQDLLERLLQR
ncbi:lytic murein transglycosylase [Pseudorhodoferax aquiterrae]|uniref:lytic murein transglycosylase n=1 Tax=Pseudorhodoferax aquiterrae TaxID=747304 RepID=UPI0016749CF0|nr:lytic murein transglycosylase [Pseudorhodoferax aquiterrae]